MRDYFGEHRTGGRVFGTSKAGGDGILSVVMRLEGGSAKPQIDHSLTQVIGVNSKLQQWVFEAANHELAHVDLPKEVHVEAQFGRATIALDEKNRIRDVRDWEQVQRYVGGASAAWFWMTWGKNLKVS